MQRLRVGLVGAGLVGQAEHAFYLWEERERTRAEILAAVDEAEASLAHGEGRIITQESMRELAESVKQRGRARLATEQTTSR